MSRQKITILNVNDDDAIRFSVTQILEDAGYEVWEAVDGAQALGLVERGPDIVVLDIQLPDIDGLEVCRRIKATPSTASITVIHLSATLVKGEDKARGLEGGADGYLTSPVGQAELVATVRAFVRLRQAEASQRFLGSVTAAMAATLDVEASLQQLARLAVPFLGQWCIVHRLYDDGKIGIVARAHAGATDDPLASEGGEGGETLLLRKLGMAASICVPLVARGRTLGSLTVVAPEGTLAYEPWVRVVVEEVGQRAAVCVDNARLYEEAQRAVRMRENFLAVVSHDLKNPLGSIMMANTLMAEQLSDEGAGLAPLLRHTQIIERSAVRMDRLITDLLDLASLDAGQLSMDLKPAELGAIALEAAEMHAALARHEGVQLVTALDPDLPPVRCDRDRVQQVLTNLIANAIKFTPAGGTITLRATRTTNPGGQARLSVIDSGTGIQPEHLGQLFERFWQASKTGRSGSGLGLSIARGIVEAQGGTIWAESVPGQGSTFSFTLPFAAAFEPDAIATT
jgi:signal transduction histidine kinase/CheY-like chemotaxis protein